MRVFVTGASGFIGRPVCAELIAAGHEVLGLARSAAAAQSLSAAGINPHRGSIEALASLRSGAAKADAVVHLAFNHDFSKFQENCENDARAIQAIGAELEGSGRPFIVTSGLGLIASGPSAVETDSTLSRSQFPRAATEEAVNGIVARGVHVRVVRLPQVHDPLRQGLVSYLIAIAKEKGVSAYVQEGLNRWPAVHVLNAAQLYALALEHDAEPGTRYHAVAEEGVPLRDIAEAVGFRLNVPVRSIPASDAAAHFGWLALFAAADLPASSQRTRERLHWAPKGPGLISDLRRFREIA